MDYEYTRFGAGFQRRKAGSTDDWKEVPMDDADEAKKIVEALEAERSASKSRGAQGGIEIRRVSQGEPGF
jgi:hypothetical protein